MSAANKNRAERKYRERSEQISSAKPTNIASASEQNIVSGANIQIWVDADACPRAIKEILFRAAERTRVLLILVANQPLRTPPSELIRSIIVPGGFDVADEHITGMVQAGDLVITADIPLAAAVIAKGAYVLNPRGTLYNKDNIGEALSLRNWMSDLRSSGVETGGPASFSPRDRENFANQLDRFLRID